ncbi:hypothetical protein LAZ67_21002056 [Cordylochernes scorpioides]|uniref:SPIN-DOC-like zinc-finger domain-containing protein n=1 Tax=Cordylochernes scorpioides TaxID=51811 RepID=A0ABY6LSE2_9ARAC|nr:hypothetical protein LAZ67_21002056 [Cordylochernes scorpioides]
MSSSKPSGSKTKRKIADEHRNFQEKGELENFCSEVKDKIICLICNNAISVPKLYNIKRHYKQHKSKYDTYEGLMRQEKLKEFKLGMKKQQFMFTKVSQESEAAVHASYVLSEMIDKHSKPFTEGDFIKECLIKAAEIVCPGSVKTFQAISLSRNTVVERVTDMARNLNDQIKEKSSCFEAFSIACDETCDTDFNIFEELLELVPMHGTTTGEDIFNCVYDLLQKYNLPQSKLTSVATDGAPSMTGKTNGFVALLRKTLSGISDGSNIHHTHCIIHQEVLCTKVIKMENVLTPIKKFINFIRSRGLNQQQFSLFLTELESEYSGLSYYTEVADCRTHITTTIHTAKSHLPPQLANPLEAKRMEMRRDQTTIEPLAPEKCPKPKKARMSNSKTKVLLVTFFDHQSIGHHEFLPQGQTINQNVYLAILRRLLESIRKKRPEKLISGEWMLHHDNAPANRALSVGAFLTKNSMLTMPHPPYSPDLAPNDFFLFSRMKSVLKGYRFDTVNAIKEKSLSVLKGITSDGDFGRIFGVLPELGKKNETLSEIMGRQYKVTYCTAGNTGYLLKRGTHWRAAHLKYLDALGDSCRAAHLKYLDTHGDSCRAAHLKYSDTHGVSCRAAHLKYLDTHGDYCRAAHLKYSDTCGVSCRAARLKYLDTHGDYCRAAHLKYSDTCGVSCRAAHLKYLDTHGESCRAAHLKYLNTHGEYCRAAHLKYLDTHGEYCRAAHLKYLDIHGESCRAAHLKYLDTHEES